MALRPNADGGKGAIATETGTMMSEAIAPAQTKAASTMQTDMEVGRIVTVHPAGEQKQHLLCAPVEVSPLACAPVPRPMVHARKASCARAAAQRRAAAERSQLQRALPSLANRPSSAPPAAARMEALRSRIAAREHIVAAPCGVNEL